MNVLLEAGGDAAMPASPSCWLRGRGDDDECPTGPSYLPTKTEVCEDISPTDEFCTEPAWNDCCATNAVAASLAVRCLRLWPSMAWYGMVSN